MAPETPFVIVTIDGPAGAGKSTVARALAKRIGFAYLDTGAMYRALTLKAMRLGADLNDEQQLVAIARETNIELVPSAGGLKVYLDGREVTEEIRSLEVTSNTSFIANKAGVREIAVGWQRVFGSRQNTVVEGRDVGSVVFPKAKFKFYLDATPAERARRRADELRQKGVSFNDAQLLEEMQKRDHKDMTRDVSPLVKPSGAIVLETTGMGVDGVADALEKIINKAA